MKLFRLRLSYCTDGRASVESFALQSILPSNTKDFARYPGSLTTPKCNEVVTWTVFKKPITITSEQVVLTASLFVFRSCLVLSSTILGERVGRTMDKRSPSISVVGIPHLVHGVMLLIQDVLGLPRLRVPGMVPCIMSFSRHSPSLRITCPQ